MMLVAEERKDLLEFLDSYVTMKTMTEEKKLEYNIKNVIEMDIISLVCETKFGILNLEICHYLKEKIKSDGMTVKFRFADTVNSNVKSRVREAIFKKDVSNYHDNLFGDTELISLQIDTVEEFKVFFEENIIREDIAERRSVRSFIK
ncbi:gp485 [Bacillus phage G]|uniref:Gp485 n=1 Tax=Bacillus phage G TaxID=2884420 RepID=G3MAM6_9CAUD|nr:gp485 [Bacillus phage G]AEO93743.1 gp485 [Bacillus phage G]